MTGATLPMARRAVLRAAGAAAAMFLAPPIAFSDDPETELVAGLFGRRPAPSERLRLDMPPVFANGYTVPLALQVESPMTEADYVSAVHIFAPRNPFLRVASFHFTPLSGKASLSTRIRLAEPQNVIAVAELSDGSIMMAKTWVEVEINGCT